MEKALQRKPETNQVDGTESVGAYRKLAEAVLDSKERRGYHHEEDAKILAEYGEEEAGDEVVLIDNLGALASWNEDMSGSRAWTG